MCLIVGVQMVWFGAHNLCCRSVSSHAWSPTLAGTNGFGVQYSVRVGGQLTGTVSTMPTNTMLSSMLWPRSSWTEERLLIFGPDRSANMLEIVVLDHENEAIAIHAMKMRPQFTRWLSQHTSEEGS